MPDAALLNERFVAQARILARGAAALVMVLGALVLMGWLLDSPLLAGLSTADVMKANAAIAFVLAGGSLWMLVGESEARQGRAGQVLGLVAGLVGAATLAEYPTGWNIGIDQLLFTDDPAGPGTTFPGRMSLPTAVCVVLAGLALILLHRGRSIALAQTAAVGIGLVALPTLIGYAYGVEAAAGPIYRAIPLHTAVALLALGLGLLAASVDRGFVAAFARSGAGSSMARRLLLVAVTVPLGLGWLRVQLEAAGYVDPRFGIVTLVIAIIVVLTMIIIRAASRLDGIERKRILAEANLRDRLHEIETIMDVLPIGVFITMDPDARQITGNRAAREFLRMSSPAANLSLTAPEDEAPRHFRVLCNGVEVPEDQLPMQRAARENVTLQDVELDVVFSDGVVRHELISARPLLDHRGRPRGAVASVMDMTARRVAEREREELLARAREAQAQAEAANRSKDEFLATVSHELRTPLNAILGWASVLRDGIVVDEETRQQALATIERNCLAQAQLVDDLLDVSRIIAGRLRLEVRPVDLINVIEAAVDVVRPQAEARRIEIRARFQTSSAPVVGDPTRLQQVVWNLLSNAVKFSPEGGSVDVQLEADAREATIRVVDFGEGIDPEFLPYVFDRFRQADGRKTRRHGGLGLGLSIARHLVEMHGGTLEAASDGLGCGACFTVRLPVGAPASVAPVLQGAQAR